MTNILAINAAYRHGGITDQTVETLIRAIEAAGGTVDVVHLRAHPIEFCLNCRECTQLPGDTPGCCVLQDGMQELIDKIEWADVYILASPTNFGSATALFKRFMERLVVYAFWSWDMNAPQYRKAKLPRKKAILISSCAAPGILGRWFFATRKQLTMTAKTIGADTVGILFTGLIGKDPRPKITARMQTRIRKLAGKLTIDKQH
jgi:multimeric flavodoxin WrbA